MSVLQSADFLDLTWDPVTRVIETIELPSIEFGVTVEILSVHLHGSGTSTHQLTTPDGWEVLTARINNSNQVIKHYVLWRPASGDAVTLEYTQLTSGGVARVGAAWFGVTNINVAVTPETKSDNLSVSPYTGGDSPSIASLPVGSLYTVVHLGHLVRSTALSTLMTAPAELTESEVSGVSGPTPQFVQNVAGTLDGVTAYDVLSWGAGPSGSAVAAIGAVAVFVYEETGLRPSPTDRYRLNLSADSRSLLASSSAVPFDASASISLPAAVGLLPQQTLYPIRELTRDATGAVHDAAFYPRATQNDRQERTYDGVTILSRMRTAFPAPIFDTTINLGVVPSQAPAIITYVFSQWATQFPWFTYETVPRLRLPLPGSTGVRLPSEYSTVDVPRPSEGGVNSTVIALPQDEGNRWSMYDILEDLLSPFPGAVFYQNAAGSLQIVPAYGPDADETPYKTLGDDDVTSVSLGEPSISTIINRCTVTSRGYQRSDAVALMQPAWFQVGPQQLFGESVWYEPPVDRVNLQAPASGTAGAILQEDDLTPADGFAAQTPGLWPIGSSVIAAGEGVSLVDSVDASLVTVAWSRYQRLTGGSPGFHSSGTTGLTLLRDFIPFGSDFEQTLRWDGSVGVYNFALVIDCAWDAQRQGVAFRLNPDSVLSRPTGGFVIDEFVVGFTLDDESVGYVETQGVTATFGVGDDIIPNEDGTGNAIEDSQAAFGVQEERIDVRGYVLNAEAARLMAQGYVLANLTPRAIRGLDLGWRGSTVAQFDDRGRLFGLPGGRQGPLVGVQYQDDFISVQGGKRVRVEETIPGTAGAIPSEIVWLLNEDGSFWQNEDGSISEVA